MPEEAFETALLKYIPRFVKNPKFKKEFLSWLSKEARKELLDANGNISLDKLDADEFSDTVYNAFNDSAEDVLTLAWDGDAPGMSGATYIRRLERIYVITSSDYDPLGPFTSLKEALKEDMFDIVTANPELYSTVLPENVLLKIAKRLVDWSEGESIFINDRKYSVSGKKLVPAAKKK